MAQTEYLRGNPSSPETSCGEAHDLGLTLAEARQAWFSRLRTVYRAQLPYALALGGAIIATSAMWLAEKSVELAVISTILQVVALPFLALAPASAFVGPYPTAGELGSEAWVREEASGATAAPT